MLNLDTHILVFGLTGELTARERKLLGSEPWGISAIVLWELSKLVQLGRITIDFSSGEIKRTLKSLQTWPLDLEVAQMSTRLDFRGDPADELIAATSVVHQVPLLTRDKQILKSKQVPLA